MVGPEKLFVLPPRVQNSAQGFDPPGALESYHLSHLLKPSCTLIWESGDLGQTG